MIQIAATSNDELRALSKLGRLYAVLDACDAPAVPILAEGLGPERCISLYRGDAEETYWDIAPYLTHIDTDELFDWIVAYSATEAWGILLVCDQPLDAVRRHLRQFLKVQDPNGERMYFRFYDPRVLEVFLPTCAPEQLSQFMGPILSFALMSPEHGARVLNFA
jgi:hypothetical protein